MTRERGWALALATVGVVVALDQLTKAWVRASVDPHEKINVFFLLDITRVKNTGVAFGALSGSGALVFGSGTSISSRGPFVAFASDASNLVPADTNSRADVFVRGPLGP